MPVSPPAAHVRFAFAHVHGRGGRRFAIAGERLSMRGRVRPFVEGERVSVRVRRADGGVTRRSVPLEAGHGGTGRFELKVPDGRAGTVTVRVSHAATASLGAFSSGPMRVKVLSPNVRYGSRSPAVWLLQRELSSLRYAVPLSGVFEAGTANAVIAYEKMNGLTRDGVVDAKIFGSLAKRRGSFDVHDPHDGRHVEADLSKQVLAEIGRDGRVKAIYTMSSGKPSTPTVLGRFRVYLKTPGTNSEGMVYSNYFVRGYAIHGYAEVPTYAASHGCLRVPIEDAIPIYGWVKLGTVVDVYD